jgi:entericidin B
VRNGRLTVTLKLGGLAACFAESEGNHVKEDMMKKIWTLTFTLLMAATVLTGCNTMEGAGEDIERGGEEIQEAS